MGRPMDYGPVAGIYATHRWALDWKAAPLREAMSHSGAHPFVVDIGCGTGDYLADVHGRFPEAVLLGCDLSVQMLAEARTKCPSARCVRVDVDLGLPIRSETAEVVYSVDVFHHLRDPGQALAESHRVLRRGGFLCVISDSTEDIYARSLARLFPETIAINLERYPRVEDLCRRAEGCGFALSSRVTIRGTIDLDDRLVRALESRAMSELRLISENQHQAGMARVGVWASRGEPYVSQTTALTWVKA
jgi:SAM-dependent methyltransferase